MTNDTAVMTTRMHRDIPTIVTVLSQIEGSRESRIGFAAIGAPLASDSVTEFIRIASLLLFSINLTI